MEMIKLVDLGKLPKYLKSCLFDTDGDDYDIMEKSNDGVGVKLADLDECPDAPKCEECKKELKYTIHELYRDTNSIAVVDAIVVINGIIDDMPLREVKDGKT